MKSRRAPSIRLSASVTGKAAMLLLGAVLLSPAQEAWGQDKLPADDVSGFPLTLTLAYSLNWSPETGSYTGVGSGTGSVHLSRRVDIGLAMRFWASGLAAREGCTLEDDRCLLSEKTEGGAFLVQTTVRPLSSRWLFLRGGAGISYVTEETAPGFVILQERAWPFTLLLGIGSDLQLSENVFLTPSVETIRTFHSKDALESAEDWQLQFGIGVTVG